MAGITITDLFRDENHYKPIGRDKYVYHYTTRAIGLEKIMQGGRLKIRSIVHTNDPYETAHFYTVEFNQMEHGDVSDDVNYYRRFYKVLCTSEDQPGNVLRDRRNIAKRGLAYSRMWAQYADKHEGVCLVFDREKLNVAVQESLGDHVEITAGSVEYAELPGDTGTALKEPSFTIPKEQLSEGGVREHLAKHKKELFFRKSFEWETECEYRWIVHNKGCDKPEYVSIHDSIVAVIAGVRCATDDVKNLCDKRGILAGRIWWINGAPRLDPLK